MRLNSKENEQSFKLQRGILQYIISYQIINQTSENVILDAMDGIGDMDHEEEYRIISEFDQELKMKAISLDMDLITDGRDIENIEEENCPVIDAMIEEKELEVNNININNDLNEQLITQAAKDIEEQFNKMHEDNVVEAAFEDLINSFGFDAVEEVEVVEVVEVVNEIPIPEEVLMTTPTALTGLTGPTENQVKVVEAAAPYPGVFGSSNTSNAPSVPGAIDPSCKVFNPPAPTSCDFDMDNLDNAAVISDEVKAGYPVGMPEEVIKFLHSCRKVKTKNIDNDAPIYEILEKLWNMEELTLDDVDDYKKFCADYNILKYTFNNKPINKISERLLNENAYKVFYLKDDENMLVREICLLNEHDRLQQFKKKRIKLNDGQQFIHDDLKDIMKHNYKVASINGPAGTGKTTLVMEIIEKYQLQNLKVAVTAPTHKALDVIREKLSENDIESSDNVNDTSGCLIVSTIHSFLKLKQRIIHSGPNEGKVEFIPDPNPLIQPADVDVLLLDESSMNSEDMRKKINMLFRSGRIKKLIYIGDKYQLTSVDDPYGQNKVYNKLYAKQFNLTEVMRQDNPDENEIIDVSILIRNEIDIIKYYRKNNYFYDINIGRNFFQHLLNEGKHIKIFNTYNQKDYMDVYYADSGIKSVIGYTNKLVDNYNNDIRNTINNNFQGSFAEHLENINGVLYIPRIKIDDVLVFQKPHVVDNCPYHQSGEVVTVTQCEIAADSLLEITSGVLPLFNGKDKIRFYKILDNKDKGARILHPQDQKLFDEILAEMKRMALSGTDKKKSWKKYYAAENYFQNVKYGYSTTIHKSQGSTYENVYLDSREMLNIIRSPEMMESCLRLVYVGITRPKNNVYVLK